MSRNRDIERAVNGISEHARHYADEAGSAAQDWIERGRRYSRRSRDYGRQLARSAEDVADEARYQYRRLKRQAKRHPLASAAVVAGTVGAFLVLRHLFRNSDED